MRKICSIAVFLSIATLIAIILCRSAIKEASVFLASLLLFVMPGFPLVSILYGKGYIVNLRGIAFACIIGLSISCFLSAIIVFLAGWNLVGIALAIVAFSAALYFIARRVVAPNITPSNSVPWDKVDSAIILIFLCIALMSVAYPYINVGRHTDRGYAYTSLFSHDFSLRASKSIAVSRDIPPKHMEFAGEMMRYYWLSYVFPAFVYIASGRSLSMHNIMLLVQIAQITLFICIMYSVFRLFSRNRKVLFLSMLLGLCAYSFNWIYILFKFIANRIPVSFVSENLLEFSNMSHGFYVFFLFQPEAIMALSILLIIMHILHDLSFKPDSKLAMLTVGVLLGLAIGIETITGVILVLWITLVAAMKALIRRKEGLREVLRAFPLLLVPSLVICSLLFYMGMFSYNGMGMGIAPNKLVIITLPFFFLLEYGAMFVFGMAGLIILWKHRFALNFIPVILLGTLSLFFVLFLGQSMEEHLGVIKVGRIFQLALLILSAVFLEYIFTARNKRKLMALTVCLVALGVPTFFVDICTGSNIWDVSSTTYVSDADHKACEWIKRNVPTDAVIQSAPSYPGYYSYSLMTMSAERRTALGPWKIAAMLHGAVDDVPMRHQDIKELFSTSDAAIAQQLIEKYGIQYIYFGPHEISTWPDGASKFADRKDLFTKVYSNDGVNIYKTHF